MRCVNLSQNQTFFIFLVLGVVHFFYRTSIKDRAPKWNPKYLNNNASTKPFFPFNTSHSNNIWGHHSRGRIFYALDLFLSKLSYLASNKHPLFLAKGKGICVDPLESRVSKLLRWNHHLNKMRVWLTYHPLLFSCTFPLWLKNNFNRFCTNEWAGLVIGSINSSMNQSQMPV